MGTYIIINARTRQVRAQLDAPCENTRIFALDLAGDTWQDFEYFCAAARRFESEDDMTNRNRHLRAAISSLYSHFDGVVGDLFGSLSKRDGTLRQNKRRGDRDWSVGRKARAMEEWIRRQRKSPIPALSSDMKLLRDILNHPSIAKESSQGEAGETIVYDAADVYGLAIKEVEVAAKEISDWLDAVCVACEHQRFCDTAGLTADFAKALGTEASSIHEF
jgi:hypothetical protein